MKKHVWLRVWLVAVVTGVIISPQAASPAAKPVVVRATIWPNLIITVAPKTFRRGTVVFKVKNRDKIAHHFSINGSETANIGAGKAVKMAVTFKKASTYTFTLPDYQPNPGNGYQQAVGGTVKVT